MQYEIKKKMQMEDKEKKYARGTEKCARLARWRRLGNDSCLPIATMESGWKDDIKQLQIRIRIL